MAQNLPTKTALEMHPRAVIILAVDLSVPDKVAAYDFEWFDTPQGVADYLPMIGEWAAHDVKAHIDGAHIVVPVKDTADMTVEAVAVFVPDAVPQEAKDAVHALASRIQADPSLAVAPVAVVRAPRKKAAAPAQAPQGGGVVAPKKAEVKKGRGKGAAAAAIQGSAVPAAEDAAPPAPKKRVRKAPAKQEAAGDTRQPVLKGEARAEALKARLDARKKEAEAKKAEVVPVPAEGHEPPAQDDPAPLVLDEVDAAPADVLQAVQA